MVGKNEIKNIFLSASIPLPERDSKYIDTADIIAIRDAVIALTAVVLPHHRLIWGGHPSVTPLVYFVMEKLKLNIQDHVTLYQSKLFERYFPEDNTKFNNVILTDIIDDDREKSLLHMRNRMLSESEFSAAVFIGGMEGVEDEYRMFKEINPGAIILPIASTGGATKLIYETIFPKDLCNERFVKDYGYMSLFQTLLLDHI
ncbi:hypothetical protein [Sphingobacterium thalpophilum]|uniref:SLOG domain-containing protein n=1 Tax=Sphingobacterium thalpophilum TaxID=259 RepID=UPI003D990A87